MAAYQWHSEPLERVATRLHTNITAGLSSTTLKEKHNTHGSNELPKEESFYLLRAVLDQLRSPLSIVLIAAGMATLVLGEYLDAIVIGIALLINIVVGVLQEYKASRVFDALASSQETEAVVVRNGRQQVVDATTLVPGDLVELASGASVPADIRLTRTQNLSVNEAALTGEWLPVEKRAETLASSAPVTERTNMAWMGTLVAEGEGEGIVVATGIDARFGKIATSIAKEHNTITPLQRNIRQLARFLLGVIAVAIVLIVVVGVVRGEPFASMLLLGIAVAVAAMPEGLPAAVTVVLALGMEAILRKGGLVKNLLAAETLGSTTIVLTDKTGTLTKGRMLMSGLYTGQHIADGSSQDSSVGALTADEVQGDNRELLKMAVLASDAFIEEDPDETGKLTVRGRPLERAITEAGLEAGLAQQALFDDGYQRIDFLPFSASRRFAVSLNECPQKGNRAYLSGSPEHLLARSKKYFANGRERALTSTVREQFEEVQRALSEQGFRFTAVAYARTTDETVPETIAAADGADDFVFVGLLAFSDAVRDDVAESIAVTQRAGARVIMATGDYAGTARAIAREVGIVTDENAAVLTGADIDELDDDALFEALQHTSIVARVVPEQKLRIAHLLRNRGEVVAMTGDGVNDAPALVAADIGVAVGSGTDVAKAAADMVLIKNSFSVITVAIAEGRRVVTNLRKIVAYLLSTSFSEIIVIGGALTIGAPLPLLPTQILWANIVQEGFMSFPFAFEPQERDAMQKSPRTHKSGTVLTTNVKWLIAIVSIVTGLFLFALFYVLHIAAVPVEDIRTVMFVALSMYSMFFAFSFKNLDQPIWRISLFSNRYLLMALGASMLLLLAALTFEPLKVLLSLTALTAGEIAVLAGLGIANLLVVEVVKFVLRHRLRA